MIEQIRKNGLANCISIDDLRESFKLIKSQLSSKKSHSIRDFEIYRKHGQFSYYEQIGVEGFYRKFILNSRIYNYKSLFIYSQYVSTKNDNKNRIRTFLPLEIRIVYEALVISLIKKINSDINNIHCENYSAIPVEEYQIKKDSVTFTNTTTTWKIFHSKKNENLKKYKEAIIVDLDVKSFYYTIDHDVLKNKILNYLKHDNELKVDPSYFMNELLFFLKMIMKDTVGLPVSEWCFASSRLSNIFMYEFDSLIDYCVKDNIGGNYQIIRYCDDINIVINKDSDCSVKDIKIIINQAHKELYSEYNLTLNTNKNSIVIKTQKNEQNLLKNNDDARSCIYVDDENTEEEFLVLDNEINRATKSPEQISNELVEIVNEKYKKYLADNVDFLNFNNEEKSIIFQLYNNKFKDYTKSDKFKEKIKKELTIIEEPSFVEFAMLVNFKPLIMLLDFGVYGINNLISYIHANFDKMKSDYNFLFLLDYYDLVKKNYDKKGYIIDSKIKSITEVDTISFLIKETLMISRSKKMTDLSKRVLNIDFRNLFENDKENKKDSLYIQYRAFLDSYYSKDNLKTVNHLISLFDSVMENVFCIKKDRISEWTSFLVKENIINKNTAKKILNLANLRNISYTVHPKGNNHIVKEYISDCDVICSINLINDVFSRIKDNHYTYKKIECD